MRIEFLRELKDSYLQISGMEYEKDFQMKMLENNEAEGFLKLYIREINGEVKMLYRISVMISMEDLYDKKEISFRDMEELIKAFRMVFASTEKYLLDYNGIMLEPSTIFWESGKGGFKFAYYSGKESLFWEDMKRLFEYIIRHIDHKDSKAVTAAYGIYKRICEDNINPDRLFDMEITENIPECTVVAEHKEVKTVIPEKADNICEKPDELKIKLLMGAAAVYGILAVYVLLGIFMSKIRIPGLGSGFYIFVMIFILAGGFAGYTWYNKNRQFFIKINREEITIPYEKEHVRIILPSKSPECQEENLTVILGDEVSEHCIRWQEGEETKEYILRDSVTLIGSSSDRADCIISMKGVSRIHARITNEADRFYIKDMNSTNGTRVNGRELACYELCEIKSNDKIRLGSVECIFV